MFNDPLSLKQLTYPLLVSATEVEWLCGRVSIETLVREEGFPRPVRVGKRRLWRTRELMEWAEQRAEWAGGLQRKAKSEGVDDLDQAEADLAFLSGT